MTKQWKLSELTGLDSDAIYKIARDELRIPGCSAMGDDEIRQRVIATAKMEDRLIEDAGVPAAAGARATPAAPAVPGFVQASYPPHSAGGDAIGRALVGKTVAAAIESLRDVWSIGEGVRVYCNGQALMPAKRTETILKAGDRLEMARDAGEKGAR